MSHVSSTSSAPERVGTFASQLGPHFSGRSPYQTYAAYSVAELDTTGVENIAT